MERRIYRNYEEILDYAYKTIYQESGGTAMAENAVIFKGTKDGLYIILKEEMDLNTIK